MPSAPEPVRNGEAPDNATRRRRSTYWSAPVRMFQPTSTEALARRFRARRADRRAVEPRPAAAARGEQFVAHRIVDDADFDLAAGDAGDRDAEMRDPAGEIGRAIDRIDNPNSAALISRARLGFLADEPIAWER